MGKDIHDTDITDAKVIDSTGNKVTDADYSRVNTILCKL